MILEKLEIIGFKSFADKTSILFNQPISAIVGPNGCGKSNILDALKWVMGERSIRSIRGEKMEDIIFSGTEQKKALNFAEVSITFNNKSNNFNLDTTKVTISRRFDRDGQSHFFINEKRVSLKMVDELFLDTGLGKSAYSFMEQGKMDMILSSKPEERRYIFEEAAGISRFKSNQEESEKNLEQTRTNLTRIQDITQELERELEIKKEQALKTKEYNKLLEKFKEHDLKIKYISIMDTLNSKKEVENKLEDKNHTKEKLEQKILLAEERLIQTSKEKDSLKNNLYTTDTNTQINKEKIAQYQMRIQAYKNQKQTIEIEIKSLIKKILEIEKRIENWNLALNKHNQLQLDLKIEISTLQSDKEKTTKKIEDIKQERVTLEDNLKQYKNEHLQTKDHTKLLRKKLERVVINLLKILQEQKKKWEKENTLNKKNKFFLDIQNLIQELYDNIQNRSLADIKKFYNEDKKKLILDNLNYISNINNEIFKILLNKTGIHSQKEDVDKQIIENENLIESLEKQIIFTETSIIQKQEWIHKELRYKDSLQGEIQTKFAQKDNAMEQEKMIKQSIQNEESQKKFFTNKLQNEEENILKNNHELNSLDNEISKLKKSIQIENNQIEKINKQIDQLNIQYSKTLKQANSDKEHLIQIGQQLQSLELKKNTLSIHFDSLSQNIYNDYSHTYEDLIDKFKGNKFLLSNISNKSELQKIQADMKSIGAVNPLAVEELNTIQDLYNHNQSQLKDIKDAEKSILKVIDDISLKSKDFFVQTFEEIQKNFQYTFKELFNGGNAELVLTTPETPLASGIEIKVQPPGKKARSIRLLSGGEKALTAISLLFAIYLVRSSPICILDEIDAPLDDYNLMRFLNFLDHFKKDTQFILITHNKKTMAKADYLYGVTMREPGISTLVEMKLKYSMEKYIV